MSNNVSSANSFSIAHSANSGDTLFLIANPTINTWAIKQISTLDMFGNSSSLVFKGTLVTSNTSTPANSTITVTKGTMWFDSSYLYVATANNVLKRVALTSF